MKYVAEPLELSVGRYSNAAEYKINLLDCPHIYISYSRYSQLEQLIHVWLRQLGALKRGILVACSVKKTQEQLFKNENINLFQQFIRYEDIIQTGVSHADAFMQHLIKEYKKRTTAMKSKNTTLADYPKLLVFIDEIFEVILSRKRSNGLFFMQLLIVGQEAGIHFLIASTNTYRNLLLQLQIIHPAVSTRLKKSGFHLEHSLQNRLGAELVINEDGLHFFRTKEEMIHQRLFPL